MIRKTELKQARGVSFEEILNSKFIGAEKHAKRENQIDVAQNKRFEELIELLKNNPDLVTKTLENIKK